jgi:hypothetical protein
MLLVLGVGSEMPRLALKVDPLAGMGLTALEE